MVDSRCRHCFHPPLRFKTFLPLFLITAVASCVSALSVNRTIDDQTGDSVTGDVPTYSPPAAWKQGSTCDGCFIHLDSDHVFGGTWHDATHSPNDAEPLLITAHFIGTAVYVYNVLANTVLYTTTYTSLTFSLDGEQVGTYVHVPTSDTAFQYDVPVYTNANLANKQHTLVIEATGDTNSSLVLFDYIVYTFTEDDPSPPPSSSSTTTTVASPTTTFSTTTNPVTSSATTSSATSSLSLSVLSPTGSSSVISSGTSSPTDLKSASSGNASSTPSASSTSSSTGSPSSTIVAANVSQDSSSFPVGAVAGGVVGGVIVLAVLVFLVWFLRRRQNQQTVKPASFAVDAPDHHMHDTSDVLVTTPFYGAGAGAGGSSAQATGSGSAYSMPGAGHVSSPSASGMSQTDYSAAYDINPIASTSSPSRYTTTQPASTGTRSDYSSRPSISDTAGRSDSSRTGLRPLPVPANSLRSASATPADPFVDPPSHARTDSSASSPSPARGQPPVPIPEKSPLRSVPPAGRTLPVPPAHSVDAPVSPTATTATNGTVTILRTQVAALQEEVARLREQSEMQMFMDEAPPRYDEARA